MNQQTFNMAQELWDNLAPQDWEEDTDEIENELYDGMTADQWWAVGED